MNREIRLQPHSLEPSGLRPLVRLGDVGNWSVVRRADFPSAAPFVISRKEWDKLPIREDGQ